jgi:pimeloyl-ACP methyl ester carboxylesterase
MDYVFLHGGGQGGWVWEKLIDTLSFQSGGTYGRALALDVPGCGAKRGRDTAEITVEAIAEELIADIESAGFQNVFMVGHSQAGTIIPLMLERRPDLFARVLYLACVAPAPGKTVQSFRQEMYSPEEQPPPPRATTRQEVDEVIRHYMCNDMFADEADAFMARMRKDAWPPLSYLKSDWVYDDKPATISTTYVITIQDTGVVEPLQEVFATRLKAREVVWIDSGHAPMHSRPHALAEILLREARNQLEPV